jgi:plastocyanin
MQVPKKHFPIVGLIGLVVVAAAGGGIYYYQFVLSHTPVTFAPSHRLVFMTAIIQEQGGFHITNTAFLNQTNLPSFDSSKGYNLTGVNYHNYTGETDHKTIDAHVGDTITFYILGVNATSPCNTTPANECWLSTAHGFDISGPGNVNVSNGGVLPGTIPFGKWYTVTVTFNVGGSYSYFCTIACSPQHTAMNGNIAVT